MTDEQIGVLFFFSHLFILYIYTENFIGELKAVFHEYRQVSNIRGTLVGN